MNAKRDKTKVNDEEKDNQSNDNKDHQINIEADSDKLEGNTNEREAQELSKEDELIEEITSLKEEKIRLLAEMENVRKRFVSYLLIKNCFDVLNADFLLAMFYLL